MGSSSRYVRFRDEFQLVLGSPSFTCGINPVSLIESIADGRIFFYKPSPHKSIDFAKIKVAVEVLGMLLLASVGNRTQNFLLLDGGHPAVLSQEVPGFKPLALVWQQFLEEHDFNYASYQEAFKDFLPHLFSLHPENRDLFASLILMGRMIGDQDVHWYNIGIDENGRLVRIDTGRAFKDDYVVSRGKEDQKQIRIGEYCCDMEELVASDITRNFLFPEFSFSSRDFIRNMLGIESSINMMFRHQKERGFLAALVEGDDGLQRSIFKALLKILFLPNCITDLIFNGVEVNLDKAKQSYNKKLTKLKEQFLQSDGEGFDWFKKHWQAYGLTIVDDIKRELLVILGADSEYWEDSLIEDLGFDDSFLQNVDCVIEAMSEEVDEEGKQKKCEENRKRLIGRIKEKSLRETSFFIEICNDDLDRFRKELEYWVARKTDVVSEIKELCERLLTVLSKLDCIMKKCRSLDVYAKEREMNGSLNAFVRLFEGLQIRRWVYRLEVELHNLTGTVWQSLSRIEKELYTVHHGGDKYLSSLQKPLLELMKKYRDLVDKLGEKGSEYREEYSQLRELIHGVYKKKSVISKDDLREIKRKHIDQKNTFKFLYGCLISEMRRLEGLSEYDWSARRKGFLAIVDWCCSHKSVFEKSKLQKKQTMICDLICSIVIVARSEDGLDCFQWVASWWRKPKENESWQRLLKIMMGCDSSILTPTSLIKLCQDCIITDGRRLTDEELKSTISSKKLKAIVTSFPAFLRRDFQGKSPDSDCEFQTLGF